MKRSVWLWSRTILLTGSLVFVFFPAFAQSAEEVYALAVNDYCSRARNFSYSPEHYEEALEICNEGIELFASMEIAYPEITASLYITRASIYRRWEKYEEAMRDYKKTMRLDPYLLSAHMGLARVYISLGETDPKYYQDAIELYSHVIELDPENDYPLVYRAEVYNLLGKNDKAMADIDFALSLFSGNWEIYYIKAKIFFSKGAYEEALDNVNYALSFEDTDVGTLLSLKSQIESIQSTVD